MNSNHFVCKCFVEKNVENIMPAFILTMLRFFACFIEFHALLSLKNAHDRRTVI